MKHRASAFRKFAHAAQTAARHTAPLPGGFFLTDPARIADPLPLIGKLPDGVGVIIRHFGDADAMAEVPDIVAACRSTGRTVLIAADPALAADTGADGVHWPFRLRHQARRHRGRFGIMTLSVRSARELSAARASSADAFILSTLFASASPTAGAPIGLSRLAATVRTSDRPIYALGGIAAINAERVAAISGFASVSGFLDLA